MRAGHRDEEMMKLGVSLDVPDMRWEAIKL